MEYDTSQKEILLNFFKDNPRKCFSSKQLIDEPELKMGNATVYRHIARFTKQGILKKYTHDADKKIYYQLNDLNCTFEHFHLQCLTCNKLFHADCTFMKDLNEHIKDNHAFLVDTTKTIFYGQCKECKKKAVL